MKYDYNLKELFHSCD